MISKEFNGDIYVLSEYGQGSIFTFEMEIEKNLNTTISEESIAKN
jgi:signal transduction histidine kinase